MLLSSKQAAPSFVRLFQFPNLENQQALANKSFFKADKVDMFWNKRGRILVHIFKFFLYILLNAYLMCFFLSPDLIVLFGPLYHLPFCLVFALPPICNSFFLLALLLVNTIFLLSVLLHLLLLPFHLPFIFLSPSFRLPFAFLSSSFYLPFFFVLYFLFFVSSRASLPGLLLPQPLLSICLFFISS